MSATATASTNSLTAACPTPTPTTGNSGLLTHEEHAAIVTATAVVPPPRLKETTRLHRVRPTCTKCKKSLAQINMRDQITCADCFTSLLTSKVKSVLRLKCNLGRGVRLLLGVSGGASSSALAKIFALAADPAQQKRLFFGFDLIHIDESCVAIGAPEESLQFEEQVKELYDGYVIGKNHVRFLTVPLEEVMNIGTEFEAKSVIAEPSASSTAADSSSSTAATPASTFYLTVPSANAAANRAALQSMFNSLKDSSDKSDFLTLLRLRLLSHIARQNGYNQVVLGDNCSHTSIEIFSDTSKGRGACVPYATLFTEPRFQVTFMYPAREQNNVSIALFNHFMGIKPIIRPIFTSSKKSAQAGAAGINKLTHDFLCMLDAKFSSTVSNIFGTVAKLSMPLEYHSSTFTPTSHCSLCGRPKIEAEEAENARTQHAGIGAMHLRNLKPENMEIINKIPACYGCAALMREFTDASLLPTYIRLGLYHDHRQLTADATTPTSTYPSPFNSTIALDGGLTALTHDQRMELNRAKKAAKAEQQRLEEEMAAAKIGQPPDGHREGHVHGGLQKQTREDMKASFAEFELLPDE